ncbi:MAG: type III pantothenate kinase [Bacteroidetes bacterium]|nr:type III pantothenate kinase [Bacteroidota bacterium]
MEKSIFILDIGNSRAKLSSYKNSIWKYCLTIQRKDYSKLGNFIKEKVLEQDFLIWTSVVEQGSEIIRKEKEITQVELNRSLIDLETISYATPSTLGLDRYFACLGARVQSKTSSCIVIDAGTALTIDLMNKEDVYEGGVISPGLQLWETGLKEHAPALPNVVREIPKNWPPKSTSDALKWGISGGFVVLIESMIEKWNRDYPDTKLFSTGGDGEWVSQQIPNCTFDRFLVEKGCFEFWENQKLNYSRK